MYTFFDGIGLVVSVDARTRNAPLICSVATDEQGYSDKRRHPEYRQGQDTLVEPVKRRPHNEIGRKAPRKPHQEIMKQERYTYTAKYEQSTCTCYS